MAHAEYETTMIFSAKTGGAEIENVLTRFQNTIGQDGKMVALNHWGRKRLAYPIAKERRGIYVHAHYAGGADTVAKVERDFRLSEYVVRFLTIKLRDDVAVEDLTSAEYVAPDYDAMKASPSHPMAEARRSRVEVKKASEIAAEAEAKSN